MTDSSLEEKLEKKSWSNRILDTAYKFSIVSFIGLAGYIIAPSIIEKAYVQIADKPEAKTLVETESTSKRKKDITVDVVVDIDSYTMSQKDINSFMEETNHFLSTISDSRFRLRDVHKMTYKNTAENLPFPLKGREARVVMRQLYDNKSVPEHIILLTKDKDTASAGGYISYFSADDFSNPHNPTTGKDTVTIGAVDPTHHYAGCGYDRTDSKNPIKVSNRSIGGECRGQVGTECEFNPAVGYDQCKGNQANPKSRNKYSLAATIAVHEFLHAFGNSTYIAGHTLGTPGEDHYGTPGCKENADNFKLDLNSPESIIGICPDVVENFNNSAGTGNS